MEGDGGHLFSQNEKQNCKQKVKLETDRYCTGPET